MTAPIPDDVRRLTTREREVLAMIAVGLSTAQIAERLHRSVRTIETHRHAIGRKLGVRNRVELARVAIRSGLVDAIDDGQFDRARYRDAIAGARGGAWDWDMAAGALSIDPELHALLRCSSIKDPTPQELLGHVHPDDRDAVEAHVAEAISGQSDWIEIRCRFLCGDGGEVRLYSRGHVWRNVEGAPERIVGLTFDVST